MLNFARRRRWNRDDGWIQVTTYLAYGKPGQIRPRFSADLTTLSKQSRNAAIDVFGELKSELSDVCMVERAVFVSYIECQEDTFVWNKAILRWQTQLVRPLVAAAIGI